MNIKTKEASSLLVAVLAAAIVALATALTHGVWWVVLCTAAGTFLIVALFTLFVIRKYVAYKLKPIYSIVFSRNVHTHEILDELKDKHVESISEELSAWAETSDMEIARLKETEKFRKEYLGNVAHELKTPIAAIMMSLNLLEDKRVGALNDEQEQLSRSIKENSERLLSITGELLNMTQVEAGKLQLMPKITKPIELIEYAIKANQVQADKFNIQIEVEYPEEKIGKLFVDSEKIAWVLTNLLSNAIRYSKENGRVIIGARQDGNIIELYVQDFGKGIDPRYHQSIFDRYFRVPGTKVQGSGLGLSISKDFVEAHGGTLTVESELGKGSRFVMRLKA